MTVPRHRMEALPTMPVDLFKRWPELAGAKIAFGLSAQGHLATVEQMVTDGRSWEDIGAAIGWSADAVEQHWKWHVEDRATGRAE